MAVVHIDDLAPGMVVSRNVCDRGGRVLLPAGCALTERHFPILRMWGVMEAEVACGEEADAPLPQGDTRVFNRADFLFRLAGAEEFVDTLLRAFLAGCDDHLAALERAIAAGDAEAVRFRAHTICGSAANVAAPTIAEAAGRIELLAKAGELGRIPALYRELLDACCAFRATAGSF